MPEALKIGIAAFAEHRDCGMTFGSCKFVNQDRNPLPVYRRALDRDDYYLAFLRRCYVGHPAAAMFRRSIIDAGVIFDESLPLCSDYEFYLQVARRWPVHCHNQTVSEYRQHGEQKSSNRRRMVEYTVTVLQAQTAFASGNKIYARMLRKGIRILHHDYSRELLANAWKKVCCGRWRDARRDFVDFLFEPPLAGWTLARGSFKPYVRRLRVLRKNNVTPRTSYMF